MSTSRSDDPSKTGVGSLFKRAVAAHAAKSEAEPVASLREGIEQMICGHCGAPRQGEARVCRFCNRAI